MSQIVSRSRQPEGKPDFWKGRFLTVCKKPFLLIFHGAAASTYGFAICWQNVSAASGQLYLRTNPAMRAYGRWRFLTYNCLVMQFVAYSLCLSAHFVPKLRRPRDFFFTTFAFPVGMLVVSSFWTIWLVAGREYIFPSTLEPFYPSWLNHITHTIIAPINLIELLMVRHHYNSDKKQLIPLTGYIASYISFMLYIKVQTGRFVYPFLNVLDPVPVGAIFVSTAVFTIFCYKSGRLLHDFVHGFRNFKDKFSKPNSKKSTLN